MKTFLVKMREFSRRHIRAVGLATAFALANAPAYAAMDFKQGALTLGQDLLVIFGVVVLVTGGYKAYHCYLNEHTIVPTMVGMMFALALCFGGAWFLGELGGAGTINVGTLA